MKTENNGKQKADLTVYMRVKATSTADVHYRKRAPKFKGYDSLLDLIECETEFTIAQNLDRDDFFDIGPINGDNCIPIALTRDQLRQLADELIALSNNVP